MELGLALFAPLNQMIASFVVIPSVKITSLNVSPSISAIATAPGLVIIDASEIVFAVDVPFLVLLNHSTSL